MYSPIVNCYDPKLFGTDCDGRFTIQLSIADHSLYRLSKNSAQDQRFEHRREWRAQLVVTLSGVTPKRCV